MLINDPCVYLILYNDYKNFSRERHNNNNIYIKKKQSKEYKILPNVVNFLFYLFTSMCYKLSVPSVLKAWYGT